jgi:hypothetical protein
MKRINRYFSLITISATALLFTGTASAQFVFRRNAPVVRTEQSQPQADTWKPLPAAARAGSITAKVVWSRTLGLPPKYPGASEPYPMPCGLLIISISNMRERIKASEGGTLTTDRSTGAQNYVCSYVIEGLPKDQELRITAVFLDLRVWETAPWITTDGAEGVAPGAGQIRVLNGARRLTITDAEPTVNVDFSLSYETPRRPIKFF